MKYPPVSDATIIDFQRRTGLSPSQVAYRLHISPPRVRRLLEADRTPLNYKTDMLWRACQENGGCTYGTQTIRRYDVEMLVCRKCSVPGKAGKARMSVWNKMPRTHRKAPPAG